MIRNLKMLGLALVAVCAMGAVAASAASANANYWFTSPEANDWTILTGAQPVAFSDQFKVDGVIPGGPEGVTKCESTAYEGSTTDTTGTTLSLKAAYGGCELEPFGKATVSMNECEYLIHTDPLGDTTNGQYDTNTTIVCPSGHEITIEAKIAGITKCIVHIEPQTLGTGIVLTNATSGGKSDIHADINFSTIKYTQTTGTSGSSRCTTTGTTTNGVYTGTATIKGFNTALQQVNISMST